MGVLDLPLHDFHAERGARFVAIDGWNMPQQYRSSFEEYEAIHGAAGLFDESALGELYVTGGDARIFLERLMVNDIAGVSVGQAVSSLMCNGQGRVVDLLTVYRTELESYLLTVNAGNLEKDYGWLLKQAERWGLDVCVEDHSDDYALLVLLGPKSKTILVQLGLAFAGEISSREHRGVTFGGEKIRVSRMGYAGEDGFELYCPPRIVEALAKQILTVGESLGLKLCGMGARESLRLEGGIPIYGYEVSDQITPFEASLDEMVNLNKADFIGKNALTEQHEAGIPRRVIYFSLAGQRVACAGVVVINAEGRAVGKVLAGMMSFRFKRPIGSAIVLTETKDIPLFVELGGDKVELKCFVAGLHQL
jgi:aminomethyltransferase